MRQHIRAAVAAVALAGGVAKAETITVATVNNGDMIVMQKLSPQWEQKTGNKINWVVLEENVLRQRVTTDIATKGGQFDVLTIGSYETPIWGKQWLARDPGRLPQDLRLRRPVRLRAQRGSPPADTSMRCRSMPRARSPCTARTCSTQPA